jgi:nitroreductase
VADLLEVMRTTFAARAFSDAPVPDDALLRILDDARFAPSGGNRQGWRVIVVREAETKRALAELARPTMQRYAAQVAAGESPWNTVNPTRLTPAQIEATPVPPVLLDALAKAPVLLVVCVDLAVVASFDSQLPRVGVISGASVYPFVWNLLLAANAEGLGGTLTTFCTGAEPAVQKLLGIPAQFAVAAVLPIAGSRWRSSPCGSAGAARRSRPGSTPTRAPRWRTTASSTSPRAAARAASRAATRSGTGGWPGASISPARPAETGSGTATWWRTRASRSISSSRCGATCRRRRASSRVPASAAGC